MREFPRRLSHVVPSWVADGSTFHIRIRLSAESRTQLTEMNTATALLDSVREYHRETRWHCRLFLLMPDHLHALLSFPPDKRISGLIGGWKSYHAKHSGIRWQDNFFDHRIRSDASLNEKASYIRNNPVAKGLCARPEDWPWVIGPLD
jgi:REP element-mobilizing transposase RayT